MVIPKLTTHICSFFIRVKNEECFIGVGGRGGVGGNCREHRTDASFNRNL